LQEQLKDNEEGWVGIDIMLKFQRLSKLSADGDVILAALKKAVDDNLIEVDCENKKIRRNPENPLPEKEDDEAKKAKTVYAKGFEKEATSLDDLLAYFAKYDNVIHVNRRTWQDRKDDSRHFKVKRSKYLKKASARPWKDHFKSDLRSDQDHLLQIIFFLMILILNQDHFLPQMSPF
jgi:hypothetical protein